MRGVNRFSVDILLIVANQKDLGVLPTKDTLGSFCGVATHLVPCDDGHWDCDEVSVVYEGSQEECFIQTAAIRNGVITKDALVQALVAGNQEYDATMAKAKVIANRIWDLTVLGRHSDAYMVWVRDENPLLPMIIKGADGVVAKAFTGYLDFVQQQTKLILVRAQQQPDPEAWLTEILPQAPESIQYLVQKVKDQFFQENNEEESQDSSDEKPTEKSNGTVPIVLPNPRSDTLM